ncbi:unnamed protein product [Clonostachys solani]|uniref:Uncharacterized protein n=1 Tax=Clonostachys solani TaxID=160281 RepID=A0A9N9W8W6_9HYPO|nr:unnamed protein product [Clonostachys solani]
MAPDTLSLQGKIAIVTGSGKENGIGAAIATALARNGCSVAINHVSDASSHRAAEVEAKIKSLGARVVTIQADISTVDGAKEIVNRTPSAFNSSKIDILVNNAAVGAHGITLDISPEVMERIFRVNVFGPLFMIQETVPFMPRGGRIINTGSTASKTGFVNDPIYAASKAAMDQLTFALSRELGRKHGLTINTIAPGSVKTDNFPDDPNSPAVQAFIELTRAEARAGNVEDIADVALLLASEKSRWLTGQYISASGGVTGG